LELNQKEVAKLNKTLMRKNRGGDRPPPESGIVGRYIPGRGEQEPASYWVFLVASLLWDGFAMLQIAANPYVTILGRSGPLQPSEPGAILQFAGQTIGR